MRYLSIVLFILALLLLGINFYGLTKSLRPQGLTPDVLRFGDRDIRMDSEEFEKAILRRKGESDSAYAVRLTKAIEAGMAHVKWLDYDPDRFHQRVPLWENYILYLMGVFSGIPEFERYHFTDPYRSIERGIGICGDASMTLSTLLKAENIDNKIVTTPGHVMVEAFVDEKTLILDADFGVVLPGSIREYEANSVKLVNEYQNQRGLINDGELAIAAALASNGYVYWNGASHFITKKYYFEIFAYFMKWFLPICLLLYSLYIRFRKQ